MLAPEPRAEGRTRGAGWWNLLLVLPAAVVILIFFVWPVVNLLGLSFTQPRPGLANYTALVTRPVYLRVLWNTAVISATVDTEMPHCRITAGAA